ncbi:MAG TPA: ester cyclase [Candidatus Tectomicrobia bacterium]
MSVEENKAIARRHLEDTWNAGNLALVDEMFVPGCVFHPPDSTTVHHGTDALKRGITRFRSAFPDMHIVIEDVCAEGDTVVLRWSGRGTHTGEIVLLQHIPPTGKQVTWSGMDLYHMAGGKIVEGWRMWDRAVLLQQLGVVPTSG